MKVIAYAGGQEREFRVGGIAEGQKGLYMKDGPGSSASVIGYIPYDNLRFVGPEDD